MRRRACILWSVVLLAVTGAAVSGERRGEAQERLGTVSFPVSCTPAVQPAFDRAVALLHSFWFDAAIRAFSGVAQADPDCAMAYWGIAMTLFHAPAEPALLAHGWAAVERAKAARAGTARERDYLAAIETFYRDWGARSPRARALAFEQAMAQLPTRYPDDPEAAIFHALALAATAQPTDKSYAPQLGAAAILERQFAERPDHPGVAHYLLHAYDYPGLAGRGLAAARRYAAIAPSVPHALHMPSHVFTRLGLWAESIASNRASAAAATHEHDRLHAWDYLVYAYLQLGQDREAARLVDEVAGIKRSEGEDFVAAHAFAAIPARYALERGRWTEAAALALHPGSFAWRRFPQAEALTVFARALGAARSGDVATAARDLARLEALRDTMAAASQEDWAEQAAIQGLVVAAWIARAEDRPDEALGLGRAAADREDATEKHPVTPGPIVPARELLGELLVDLNQPAAALREFDATLRREPSRFRALAGAARAAELAGHRDLARARYAELLRLVGRADAGRSELDHARAVVAAAPGDGAP